MITRILKWFNSLPRREQWLLFCAAGLVLVLLLVQGLWRPLARENARLDARNQESVETLAWMLSSADEVIELRASGAGTSSRSSGPSSATTRATPVSRSLPCMVPSAIDISSLSLPVRTGA